MDDTLHHAAMDIHVEEDDRVVWQSSQIDIKTLIDRIDHRGHRSAQTTSSMSTLSSCESATSMIFAPVSTARTERPLKRRRPTRAVSGASTTSTDQTDSAVRTPTESVVLPADPDVLAGIIRDVVEGRARTATSKPALRDLTNTASVKGKGREKGKAVARAGSKRSPYARSRTADSREDHIRDVIRSPPRTRARTHAASSSPSRNQAVASRTIQQQSPVKQAPTNLLLPPPTLPSLPLPVSVTTPDAEVVRTVSQSARPIPALPRVVVHAASQSQENQITAGPSQPIAAIPSSQAPSTQNTRPRRGAVLGMQHTRSRPPVPAFQATSSASKLKPLGATPKSATKGAAKSRFKIPSFKPPVIAPPQPPSPPSQPVAAVPATVADAPRPHADQSFSSGDDSFGMSTIDPAELEAICSMYDS